MDIIEIQKSEAIPRNTFDNGDELIEFLNFLNDDYLKRRAFNEAYGNSWHTLCSYVKSHEGWEYFVDYVQRKNIKSTCLYTVTAFNYARVRCGYVELYYSPLHNTDDGNNVYYGSCTFDELLDIEYIIKEHKNSLQNVKRTIDLTKDEYERISQNLNEILAILDTKENIGGTIANIKYDVENIVEKMIPYVQVK